MILERVTEKELDQHVEEILVCLERYEADIHLNLGETESKRRDMDH